MCSARAERDVPFGRDVAFGSDVRFAREESGTHHISLSLGAKHHYDERHSITAAKPQLHFLFLYYTTTLLTFQPFRRFESVVGPEMPEMHL